MRSTGAWLERVAARASLGPGRGEALVALVRACVLVLSGALLMADLPAGGTAAVSGHLAAASLSLLAVVPLSRLRTAGSAAWAAAVGTVADVLLLLAYSVIVESRPGFGTLFGLYVAVVGPARWGLRGLLLTSLPVGAVSVLWPLPSATGSVPSGWQVWVLLLLVSLPVAVVSVVWRRGLARLRQADSQFQAAFEHASIGMALLDHEGRVLQANAALADLLGSAVHDLVGTPLLDRVAGPDREELADALVDLARSGHGLRAEVRFRRVDGELRWGLVAASWLAGSAGITPRAVLQVENVTDRKAAESRLAHLAQHDPLTGLPNRTLLLAHLDSALAEGHGVCLVFLDLDRFKVVNDGLGHAAGDRLLVEVADRLRAVMRPGDVVARLGGDEFVVLCHGVRREDEAAAVAERVLSGLQVPVRLDARSEVLPTASAGVAIAGPGSTPETLLRDADTAMYGAKAAGGGRARLFTPDQHDAARRRHELEAALRRALAEERLELHYQPVVDLTTGRVGALEALLRWDDDERGPVRPAEFIAVAEQSALIDDLGTWVLERALRDARDWPAGARGTPPRVAVNVAPRQLLDPDFAARVAAMLAEHGVPAARLCLEITETALVADTSTLVPALTALREVGVLLAIDDFGTGHASLTYLAKLPVDLVKIDQTFVAGVADDAGSAAIVGGVVAMAEAFGMSVVAEGVETVEQLQALRRLGVHHVQGFLIARPMREPAVRAALAATAAPVPLPRTAAAHGERPRPDRDAGLRLQVLLQASRDITACVDLDGVLVASFAALRRLVDFTGGSIQLVDGDVVRLAATDPPATAEAMAATLLVGTGISGGIAATGEARYLPDITVAAAVSSGRRRTSSSPGVRSWYGVPLVAEGRVIGVLQVESTRVDAFDEADRLLVLSFAPVVASAVQSTRRFAAELEALQHPPG